jgi:cation:H+ antiporter
MKIEDLGRVPRFVMKQTYPVHHHPHTAPCSYSGLIIYFAAHPILYSMLALATIRRISHFVFVQWVAPFLSEFPEKLSALSLGQYREKGAHGPGKF